MTEAGPKDQWPNGMGFDYFYGFFGGDMDQWHPTISENLNQIFPDVGHPGYNLRRAGRRSASINSRSFLNAFLG